MWKRWLLEIQAECARALDGKNLTPDRGPLVPRYGQSVVLSAQPSQEEEPSGTARIAPFIDNHTHSGRIESRIALSRYEGVLSVRPRHQPHPPTAGWIAGRNESGSRHEQTAIRWTGFTTRICRECGERMLNASDRSVFPRAIFRPRRIVISIPLSSERGSLGNQIRRPAAQLRSRIFV